MATNPAAQVLGSAPGVKLSFISVMRELAVCHHPGEDSIPWSRVSRIRDLVSSIEYRVSSGNHRFSQRRGFPVLHEPPTVRCAVPCDGVGMSHCGTPELMVKLGGTPFTTFLV